MASKSSDVEKGLVLVSVGRKVTEKEQKDEAKAIRADMELKFTQNRGPTQMGAAQGEHATAYALYVEFVMAMVGRYISAAQNSNYSGISNLLREMKARPQQDKRLLELFEIPGNLDLDAFEELDEKIQQLRELFSNRVAAHVANINAMKKLKEQLSAKGLTEAVVEGIKALNPDALKAEINTIRGEYFFTIAQKIAEEYLLFQNKSLHVAFRKVPGQEADSSEGAQIAGALRSLRAYNQPGLGLTSTATSSRASLMRGARAASEDTAVDDRIKIIAENINKLLFYPKIDESKVSATTGSDEQKGVLRSNDPNIFCYVVAKHLSITFATFEEFGKDLVVKNKIIDQVIDLKTKEWEFDANTAASLKATIVGALEEAAKAPNKALIDLDASLGEINISPLKKVESVTTNREEALSPRRGVATTPLYNKELQKASEAAKTPSKASPAQGNDTVASDKKKKKWF